MSIHPSLSLKDKGKRSRSVLKRFERLKELWEKEKWKSGNSIFGLPKLKALRWKMKKAKKAVGAEAVVGEGAPEAATEEKGPATKKETSAVKKETPTTKKETPAKK